MPTPQKIYAGSTLIYESPITDLPQVAQRLDLKTITASSTINTKGSWTELVASTTEQTDWVLVEGTSWAGSGFDSTFLLDIGTGASTAETVGIANIGFGYRNLGLPFLLFPLRIPANTRVAARGQSNIASRQASIRVGLLKGAARSSMPTTLDTIGADTAASRGTNMPTSNAYAQLTASTSQRYQALVAVATFAGTGLPSATVTYDIASGGAGSETVLFSFEVTTNVNETASFPGSAQFTTTYIGDIPANTRLAARQSTGRTDRDVIVYGVPYA